MKRTASARWQGGLKDGEGAISTQSGVLTDTQYSFSTRFEQGIGTNPEELIAAAHAGCFTMALSAQLEKAGLKADSLDTQATVTMEKRETGWEVTESHLDVTARIPGADAERFEAAANEAKAGCPISRLLNTKITMDARLASTA
jgi:osmotically inducible protein OsmC